MARKDHYHLVITTSTATNRTANGQRRIQRSMLEEESQLEEDAERVQNSLWLQYSMLQNVAKVTPFGN
jgi:hypothetical protein